MSVELNDLRGWISRLEETGEIRRIKAQVDWDCELGAITRRVLDQQGPALLFENIKGHRDTACTSLFTAGVGTRPRLAMMLGLAPETTAKELINFLRERFKTRVEPVLATSGPVKENIVKGDDVDLFQFPSPRWNYRDGGRYICTYCGIVSRDPETGIQNVGLYRGMVVDRQIIALPAVASQHFGQHYVKYRRLNRPMPVAVVLGGDPTIPFLGGTSIPAGICEYEISGAIRGEPLKIVKCQTVDLEVPAAAEIVLEGHVSMDPNTFVNEGPFGEYTGYYSGESRKRPTMRVDCVTHRDSPILTGTLEGMGPGHPNENGTAAQMTLSALVWNTLERSGVPGVLDVYLLPPSCVANVAIQIRQTYRGQAKQVALAVWGSGLPIMYCKNVIVVDEDIDIHDPGALEWAFAYRVNPKEGDIVVIPGLPGSPLDPSVRAEERSWIKYGGGTWDRLIVDATKNFGFERQPDWDNDVYPPVAFDIAPEHRRLIEQRWEEYGL